MQVGSGAQNTFPEIVTGGDGEAHRFAFFFRHRENFGEQQLFDGAEELIGGEVVLARRGAAQHADVQDDDLGFLATDAAQCGFQVAQRVIRADWHQNVARRNFHAFGRKFRFLRQIN